jgi:hypothetical protein
MANPLLQDVNKGWLQHLREAAPERVLHGGKAEGKIVIDDRKRAGPHATTARSTRSSSTCAISSSRRGTPRIPIWS